MLMKTNHPDIVKITNVDPVYINLAHECICKICFINPSEYTVNIKSSARLPEYQKK